MEADSRVDWVYPFPGKVGDSIRARGRQGVGLAECKSDFICREGGRRPVWPYPGDGETRRLHQQKKSLLQTDSIVSGRRKSVRTIMWAQPALRGPQQNGCILVRWMQYNPHHQQKNQSPPCCVLPSLCAGRCGRIKRKLQFGVRTPASASSGPGRRPSGRTRRTQKLSPPATLRPADNPTVPLHPMHPPACYPFPDVLRLQSPSP